MRKWVMAAVALVVLAAGTVAYAAIPDANGYMYICVNDNSGAMVAREKDATCPKGWTPSRLVANSNAFPKTTTYARWTEAEVSGVGNHAITARCDEGDVATGGGFGMPNPEVNERASWPRFASGSDVPVAWSLGVYLEEPDTRTIVVYVVCQHTA